MTSRIGPLLLIAVVIVVLSACASKPDGPVLDDRAPDPRSIPDLDAIPEPTPRFEPPSRYGNPPSYEVFGQRYYTMNSAEGYRERGVASWYGAKFHGRRTSSGEPYDMFAMTAAHTSLPLPTYVRVTNLDNGRSVVVRVNDRGPFLRGRIIDLSYAAAHRIGMVDQGTARVEVVALNAREEPQRVAREQRPARSPEPITTQTEVAMTQADSLVFVQMGAFGEQRNAEQLQRQLQDAGIESVIITSRAQSSDGFFRVRIGPKRNQFEAHQLIENLRQLGFAGMAVIAE
ncbi:rare lipoprotein A [Ectothiorhodosinus mongolicus]|uniref:Endolytic peptidoglycan transglycosylase RlpA n=1 Tax=Ectothiorhodosinus mongolicus TaxID=233100 RepID=A0A1R3W513_9GAMM|nr:septal ring lytic transglycosylase RlpA family protein [Ectothiorhodosinus mongolicus]ULX57347.1 septal ring lytic transglycosylase RlpA family protein [Ectothiorhodosinus mongolicus]SIT71096.1 rare lipoprotein A [Ectothiorhodosinus mongolicus]